MCFFLCEVRALFFNFQTLDLFPFGGGGVARDHDRAYYAITLVLLCVCSFVCVCVCVCVCLGGKRSGSRTLAEPYPMPHYRQLWPHGREVKVTLTDCRSQIAHFLISGLLFQTCRVDSLMIPC